ncbi:MAG: hypothetical protein ACE5Z5_09810 [Candidatus Bathyarchaeia archaeon]
MEITETTSEHDLNTESQSPFPREGGICTLKEEAVEAVQAGKFHIYPVKTIDEGIEILTGVRAGARRPDGTFEEGTVNDRVDRSLRRMAEKLKEFPTILLGEGGRS